MKNRRVHQILGLIIVASLCSQINTKNQSFTQRLKSTAEQVVGKTKEAAQSVLTHAQRAAQSGKQLLTKEQIIKRIKHELDIVKAGVQAAEKKLRGQVLTTADKADISLLAKHASVLAALVVVATGVGISAAYVGLKKQRGVELPTTKEKGVDLPSIEKGKEPKYTEKKPIPPKSEEINLTEGVNLPKIEEKDIELPPTIVQSLERPLSPKEELLLEALKKSAKQSSELPIHDVPKTAATGQTYFKKESSPPSPLLKEIRKGAKLKKTEIPKKKEEEEDPLKKALKQRRQAVEPKEEDVEVEGWE